MNNLSVPLIKQRKIFQILFRNYNNKLSVIPISTIFFFYSLYYYKFFSEVKLWIPYLKWPQQMINYFEPIYIDMGHMHLLLKYLSRLWEEELVHLVGFTSVINSVSFRDQCGINSSRWNTRYRGITRGNKNKLIGKSCFFYNNRKTKPIRTWLQSLWMRCGSTDAQGQLFILMRLPIQCNWMELFPNTNSKRYR